MACSLLVLTWGGLPAPVRLSGTPWTAAHQAPLSLGFPRPEYWSGLPFSSLRIFPIRGWNLRLLHLPHWQAYSFTPEPITLWRKQWQPTPVLLPGKFHGRRSLVGCSPWGREESDTTERLDFEFSLSCTGEGNGDPLQGSCLENPRDGGAWWAAESDTTEAT